MSLVPLAYIGASIHLAILCNYALISTIIFHRELAIERGVLLLYYCVFLQRLALALHCQRLLKTAAIRCNPR